MSNVPLASYVDLLKLGQAEHEALGRAALASPDAQGPESRAERRVNISGAGKGLAEFGPLTSVTGRYVVYPLDLSVIGASFLHGVYLHTGTVCRLRLHVLDEPMTVEGLIVRCRLVKGRIHEAGMKLSTRLPDDVLERLGVPSVAGAVPTGTAATAAAPGDGGAVAPGPDVEPKLPAPVIAELESLRAAIDSIVQVCERVKTMATEFEKK